MQVNPINNQQSFGVHVKFPNGFVKLLDKGDDVVSESLTKIAAHQSGLEPYQIQKKGVIIGEKAYEIKNSIGKLLMRKRVDEFDEKAANSFIANIGERLGKFTDIDNKWIRIMNNEDASEKALDKIL